MIWRRSSPLADQLEAIADIVRTAADNLRRAGAG